MKVIDPKHAEVIAQMAHGIITYADKHGLNVEIIRKPLEPLQTGNHEAVVNIWLKRQFTRPE